MKLSKSKIKQPKVRVLRSLKRLFKSLTHGSSSRSISPTSGLEYCSELILEVIRLPIGSKGKTESNGSGCRIKIPERLPQNTRFLQMGNGLPMAVMGNWRLMKLHKTPRENILVPRS